MGGCNQKGFEEVIDDEDELQVEPLYAIPVLTDPGMDYPPFLEPPQETLARTAHLRQPCKRLCGRFAPATATYCCSRCERDCGHGEVCMKAHKLTLDLLECGADAGTRTDLAPVRSLNDGVDFEANARKLQGSHQWLAGEAALSRAVDLRGPPPGDDLMSYIRRLAPVHRVHEDVLPSILKDGGLCSLGLQLELRTQGTAAPVEAAMMRLVRHPNFGALLFKVGARKSDRDLFVDVARPMFQLSLEGIRMTAVETGAAESDRDKAVAEVKRQLGSNQNVKEALDTLSELVRVLSEYTQQLAGFPGVRCSSDQDLGTDRHVFSVVGPNMGLIYGPIVIVLNRRIMGHPDFNMTPTAGTSYVSKRTCYHRPWAMHAMPSDEGRTIGPAQALDQARAVLESGRSARFPRKQMVGLFNESKLHPSAAGCYKVLAMEVLLQCRLFLMSERDQKGQADTDSVAYRDEVRAFDLGGKVPTAAQVTTEVVQNWYSHVNSHACIEGHLPSFVPLDYVEHILMPMTAYLRFGPELRKFPLADGRLLSSCVVPLDDEDYDERTRIWQEDHFDNVASEAGIEDGFCFGIEDLNLEDIFMPLTLPRPDEGFLARFRAMGQHIRLAFTNRCEQTRDKSGDDAFFHAYIVVIGAIQNMKTSISRSTSESEKVRVEVSRFRRPDAMALPGEFRDYWVTYNVQTGMVRLGIGVPDEVGKLPPTALLELHDPAPHRDLRFLAVSCMRNPVVFEMLKVEQLSALPRP